MIESFDDYDSLLSRLRVLIEERSPKLIGIEGYMGSGKTPLSCRLGSDLNAGVVEIDCSLFEMLYPDGSHSQPKDTPYINRLDLDDLANKLAVAQASRSIVIVEGICLSDVLVRIDQRAALTIYLKLLCGELRQWFDSFEQMKYDAAPGTFGNLRRDQFEYHRRVRPHENADLELIQLGDCPYPEGSYVSRR